MATNTDEEKNHHFDDVSISFSSKDSSFFDSFALFLKILFWPAGYFSLSSLWLTSAFNSTSLFQSKQDFQRRKEEMALAVEATRKRLEAVSTLSFLQNVGKGRKNCRIKPRDMKIERYLLAKIKLNAIEEKYYDFITLLTYVLYCNSLRPRSHVSGYF